MVDAIRYKPILAWRTLIRNVFLLTDETEDSPATYQGTINPLDFNDIGYGQVEVGFYFIDNVGIPYDIISVPDSNTIQVKDSFRVGHCPTSGKTGVIYKSVWKNRALYLPPVYYQFLHPIAMLKKDQFNLDILWSNDPNARRFAFTDVTQVEITDWTADIVDTEGITYNPAVDWGENPKFEVWQDNGNNTYSKLQVEPYITRDAVTGNIVSVLFSGSGELITGYLIISK